MRQESAQNLYFEARWDRNGTVRTLFPADRRKIQCSEQTTIFGLKEDSTGGLIGFIQAESSNAAYRIAQDHMLCIFMGMRECKHITPTNSDSSVQDGEK